MFLPVKNSPVRILGLALLALAAPALKASVFSFHVDINTSALTSSLSGPFYLDFMLNEGSGGTPNTVTISNFTFDNGAATGSASTFGSASGALTSSVSLNAAGGLGNELYQGFTLTTTGIHFNVTTTQNLATTPDFFSVTLLDHNLDYVLTSNSPDDPSLFELNIGFSNTLADVHTASSTSPAGVTGSVSAVPEPSTYGLCGAGALAAVTFVRRRRRLRVA